MSTTDWKSYEEFAAGIETNRLESTGALAGTQLEVALDDGTSLGYRFAEGASLRLELGGRSCSGRYDAVELGDDALLVDATFDELPRESLTLIADTRRRTALAVTSIIGDVKTPDTPRVRQLFAVGTLGDPGTTTEEPLPAPTRELIGRRALHRYSPNHLYEHVYLSSERYCWQCLEGVERGLGDCDPATTYRFDADRYVLAFREYRLDVASVFFLDFRHLRSTGKFFGLTADGVVENAPTGATIEEIGPAGYPAGVEPV